MFALLSPRLWVGLALAAVLVLTHGMSYRAGRGAVQAKWNKERAEITAAALTASETARLREQAAQKTVERVDRDFQTQKTKLAVDKRITDDRLRDFKTAISADTKPSTTSGVDDPYPAIASQCASALGVLDEYAQSVAAKATALQGYTREVCLK